jgi:hypothetical protein
MMTTTKTMMMMMMMVMTMTMTTNGTLGRVLEKVTVAWLAREFAKRYDTRRSSITVHGEPRSEWTKKTDDNNSIQFNSSLLTCPNQQPEGQLHKQHNIQTQINSQKANYRNSTTYKHK